MRPPQAGLTSDPGRFQPGILSPVKERPEERPGRKNPMRAFRAGQLGVFEVILLLAEIASALVVTWLVAQYIYTVYFDTSPRRVATSHTSALPAGIATITRTPTNTPTALRSPQSSTDAEAAAFDAWASDPKLHGQRSAKPLSITVTSTPTVTVAPTSTPTIDPALLLPKRLRIPVMFLDSPVHEVRVNMGAWEVSPMDIGHHEGTANPGEVGNMALAGHRDINSALFRELDRLKPGDPVFVSNSLREYKYIVTDSFVVSPEHTEVMDPTDDKRVTLITCTPIGLATQRLIVTAILDEG